MNKEMAWGVVRAVLAGASGYVVGKGIADQGTVNEVIGAIGVLFTATWSVWDKKSKK